MNQFISTAKLIVLAISCENITKNEKKNQSNPMVVLFQNNEEIGRTESCKKMSNPKFMKRFQIIFDIEQNQSMTVQVYSVHSDSQSLAEQVYYGSIEFKLYEIFQKPDLTLKKQIVQKKEYSKEPPAICTVRGWYVKNEGASLNMSISASKLDKKDVFGKSDPYLVFYSKGVDNPDWFPVHRTETYMKTLDPVWVPVSIRIHSFLGGDPPEALRIECYDWNKSGKPDFIGENEILFSELIRNPKIDLSLINPKNQNKKKYQNSGVLHILNSMILNEPTFDSLLRTDHSITLHVAIDFSSSNKGRRKKKSLHYINPKTHERSIYQNAIRNCLYMSENWLGDTPIFTYGFGGKFQRLNQYCFPLNGNPDNPGISGVDTIMTEYEKLLSNKKFKQVECRNIVPLIQQIKDNISKVAKDTSKYHVLVIFLRGNMEEAKLLQRKVYEMSYLPVSIIFILMGKRIIEEHGKNHHRDFFKTILNLDYGYLRKSAKNIIPKRDILNFLVHESHPNLSPVGFAKKTFEKLPDQMVEFYREVLK
ncbi:copine [Anaeramoeba ignava]|uniref:Copine n=1 Tax=Anaeramoeba ignava TaxID=1746090 RepID=A0A9Q0LPE0_ANAIG|nr:copine [Anaeramoeba ignava]